MAKMLNKQVAELKHKYQNEKDLMIFALVLHDGLKSGVEKEKYTRFDHPIMIGQMIMDNEENISLRYLNYKEALTVEASINRRDYNRANTIAQSFGAQVQIIHKEGLYWSIKRIFNRPVLIFGLVILVCSVLYLPGRIFFVQVEGNQYIPDIIHIHIL